MGENHGVNRHAVYLLVMFFAVVGTLHISAQGTAFSYEGRLQTNGVPANGPFDLRFALYDAVTNGNAISSPQTNFAVPVVSGLFITNIDFGAVFTGTNYWLSVGVRTNGSTNTFTLLWPRQPLLPVPYAIFATTASNLLGTLPASQLTGTIADARLSTNVSLATGSQTFSGTNNFTNPADSFSGTFFGNGLSLTNLNATLLATGTVPDLRLSTNVALLNRNQIFSATNGFTNTGNTFSGTFNGTFAGNGAGLTTLNGSQVTSGTVADLRLSGNVPLLNGNQSFTGVNNFGNGANTFTGNFFGNGLVGWVSVAGAAQQAVRDTAYMLGSLLLTTVTLPLSTALTNADIVRVSGAGRGGWLVKPNSGQTILGNFASYSTTYLVGLDTTHHYQDVAAAADGRRLYAVGPNISGVVFSIDSGQTWNTLGSFSPICTSIACSANGNIIYILTSGGTLEKSTDNGSTYSSVGSASGFISCSTDGSKVFTGNIACSSDGTYLATATTTTISISTNSGTTWISVGVPASNLSCLAASSDCTKLVAGVFNGRLYASSDQGTTWTTLTTSNQLWSGACMSSDGSKFAATTSLNGSIPSSVNVYNVAALPNTVASNSVCGSQGSAVEIQYIGNNQFMPVSFTGLIWAN